MGCFCSIEECFSLDDYVQVLEKEVNIDFCRSMNQIIFDQTVNSDARTYAFVTLPPSTALPPPNFGTYSTPSHPIFVSAWQGCKMFWLVIGCVRDVPEYPFDEQYDNFAFNSLLTREEVINAARRVRPLTPPFFSLPSSLVMITQFMFLLCPGWL